MICFLQVVYSIKKEHLLSCSSKLTVNEKIDFKWTFQSSRRTDHAFLSWHTVVSVFFTKLIIYQNLSNLSFHKCYFIVNTLKFK